MTVLKILAFGSGAALVLMAVSSALRAVVLPRAATDPISRTVFRGMSGLFRMVAGRLDAFEHRDRVMALFAPTALLTLPVAWLSVILVGYMAMFWAIGIDGWDRTFEVSGSSLLTLGFAPVDTLPQTALAFSEAVFGLGMVALLIAYLPTMYAAFGRRETGVALLEVRAGSPPSGVEMLVRLHTIGWLDRLDDFSRSWEEWFVDIDESHTSLAALVFFRSPQPERSWVTAAGAALDGLALAVSAVDIPPTPQAQVTIRSGFIPLRRIADYFGIDYDPAPSQGDPVSVSRADFDDACGTLESAGVPLKADRDQAWQDFAGWRVNYDIPLLGLCSLTMAPPAPWSSDRPGVDWRSMARTAPLGKAPVAAEARPLMEHDPPPPPPAAWKISDAVLALAAGVAGALVAGIALVVTVGEEPTTLQLFGIVAVSQSLGTLAAIRWVSGRKGSGNLRTDFGLSYRKGDAWGLAAGLGLQIALALTLLPILVLFDVDEAPQEAVRRTQESGGPLTALVAFLAIGLLAPFVEELLFRGLLLRAMLHRWGRRVALIGSAAVFAAIHLIDPGAVLVVPQLFVVGLVLAYMVLRRRSLGWAIFAHAGFNLTAVVALLVPLE